MMTPRFLCQLVAAASYGRMTPYAEFSKTPVTGGCGDTVLQSPFFSRNKIMCAKFRGLSRSKKHKLKNFELLTTSYGTRPRSCWPNILGSAVRQRTEIGCHGRKF